MSHPPPPIPTGAHKLAADRLLRLTAQEGTVEALEFYDHLSPGDRRVVFALVARIAAHTRYVTPVDGRTDVWTSDELRRCHNLFVQGARSPWINKGHRLYKRNAMRRSRGNLTPRDYRLWAPAEDAAILAADRPRDPVLAQHLRRTVEAIKSRRKLLRRPDPSLVAV